MCRWVLKSGDWKSLRAFGGHVENDRDSEVSLIKLIRSKRVLGLEGHAESKCLHGQIVQKIVPLHDLLILYSQWCHVSLLVYLTT